MSCSSTFVRTMKLSSAASVKSAWPTLTESPGAIGRSGSPACDTTL